MPRVSNAVTAFRPTDAPMRATRSSRAWPERPAARVGLCARLLMACCIRIDVAQALSQAATPGAADDPDPYGQAAFLRSHGQHVLARSASTERTIRSAAPRAQEGFSLEQYREQYNADRTLGLRFRQFAQAHHCEELALFFNECAQLDPADLHTDNGRSCQHWQVSNICRSLLNPSSALALGCFSGRMRTELKTALDSGRLLTGATLDVVVNAVSSEIDRDGFWMRFIHSIPPHARQSDDPAQARAF